MDRFSVQSVPWASVIVPVFNGAETLDACLSALAAQTVEKDSYEVLVVDDGSTDGSGQVAVSHGVTVIRQDHTGAGAARNRGASVARGQILLFTDADCEPLPDWIEQMLAPFSDPGVSGVKGVYRTCQRSLVARFAQAEFEEKYRRLAREGQIDFVDTYAAAYRRDVFCEHGGFDARFLLDEDQELSYRLARAGCKLVLALEAMVRHRHPPTVWSYARRKVQLGRWKVRVLSRHREKAFQDSYTPWTQKAQIALLPLAGAGAAAAAIGLTSWLPAALLAVMGLISAVPLTAIARRQSWPVAICAPPLVLLRALALGLGLVWGMTTRAGADGPLRALNTNSH
jgi:cellulose synthase/poly-beta-1,6-N-acetylglucosamine synthase-like glycosyltransferase